MQRRVRVFISTFIVFVIGTCEVQAEKICAFDPSLGKANPLGGMTTFVTLKEKRTMSGALLTDVLIERLPESITIAGPEDMVEFSSTATLQFSDMNVDQVRLSMLNMKEYFRLLTGDKDPKGFAKVNDTLTCHEISLKEIDTTLNDYFHNVSVKLHENDKQLLKEAQISWLQFRKSSCELEKRQAPTKLAESIHNSCLVRMSETRIKELTAFYYASRSR